MQDFKPEIKKKLNQVVELISSDLAKIKTGRAKPSLVENAKIREVYGDQTMELRELASISAPDPNQLVIKPWDPSVLEPIERSLAQSDLNVNPIVDAELIRIKIPSLTGERREELVKLVWQKVESGRVMIRQVRSEYKEQIEAQEGESGVSEDDIHQNLEELQQLVDQYTGKLEKLGESKEKELKTI